jgi:hypothetical protein
MAGVLAASLPAGPLSLLLVRCALAGVFAAAAVSKALDQAGTRTAATDLGVTQRLAAGAAVAVVIAEILAAVCLVVTPLAPFGALAALALLVVFSAIVAVNLRAGRRPSCNCFGQHSSTPIGASTLVRNGVLALAAATIAGRGLAGGADALGRFGRISSMQAALSVAGIVVAGLLAFHSWLLINLLRQNGRLLDRLDQLEAAVPRSIAVADPPPIHRHGNAATSGLPVGSPAPRFGLPDVNGSRYGIDDALADGQETVVIFFETRCDACLELAAELNGRDDPSINRIVAIVQGRAADVAARFAGPGFVAVLVDEEGKVAERYGVSGTPSAVAVAPDGMLGSAMAGGRAAVGRLLRERETAGSITRERISR